MKKVAKLFLLKLVSYSYHFCNFALKKPEKTLVAQSLHLSLKKF